MYNEDLPEENGDVKGSRLTEIISLIFVTVVLVFLFVKIIFY